MKPQGEKDGSDQQQRALPPPAQQADIITFTLAGMGVSAMLNGQPLHLDEWTIHWSKDRITLSAAATKESEEP